MHDERMWEGEWVTVDSPSGDVTNDGICSVGLEEEDAQINTF
jgi:hypothetical protein